VKSVEPLDVESERGRLDYAKLGATAVASAIAAAVPPALSENADGSSGRG
jgi:hypothetical protein